ncbi:MAG: hypothetical protein JST54_20775 [Deltaproteobacteria bacterium]|nr:hypothetical protein [Deltaproteobacteria bacterium]
MNRRIRAAATALGLLTCVAIANAQAPADAGLVVDGGAPDSGTPVSPPVKRSELSWSLTLADGGPLELDGGVPVGVDLAADIPVRLADFQVRLLDAASHQVSATEDIRLTDKTSVLIHPDPPLNSGSTYSVSIEPDSSDAIRDPQGQAYANAEIRFRTAGEPPPRKASHKKHHKRH